MDGVILPDDFVLLVSAVFRRGDRKLDPAASMAERIFLAKAETNVEELARAKLAIGDDQVISKFIQEIANIELSDDTRMQQEFQSETSSILTKIDGTTQESLLTQAAMRSEIGDLIGDMRTEFKGAVTEMRAEFSGMHTEIKATTESGLALARQNASTAGVIAGEVTTLGGAITTLGAVSGEMYTAVKKAVENTKLRAAIVAGCASGLVISFLPGMPLSIASNYIYERYWSRQAYADAAAARHSHASSGPPAPDTKWQVDPQVFRIAPGSESAFAAVPPAPYLRLGVGGLYDPETGIRAALMTSPGRICILIDPLALQAKAQQTVQSVAPHHIPNAKPHPIHHRPSHCRLAYPPARPIHS